MNLTMVAEGMKGLVAMGIVATIIVLSPFLIVAGAFLVVGLVRDGIVWLMEK